MVVVDDNEKSMRMMTVMVLVPLLDYDGFLWLNVVWILEFRDAGIVFSENVRIKEEIRDFGSRYVYGIGIVTTRYINMVETLCRKRSSEAYRFDPAKLEGSSFLKHMKRMILRTMQSYASRNLEKE